MIKHFLKPALLLTAFAITTSAAIAQKSESVIIRKKGEAKEKITVVIDGDKITVNGKDVKDYKNENIDVDIMLAPPMPPAAPGTRSLTIARPPMPPRPPHAGGWSSNMKDFNFAFSSNKAFLGVITTKDEKGAKISEVTKESPAEKAGLKLNDIITKVGDTKIEDADDLYAAVGKYKADDKVEITYWRDGKEKKVTVTLAENKSTGIKTFNWSGDDNLNGMFDGQNFVFNRKPRLGLQVQDLEEGTGVKVLDVDEETPAAKAGLKEGDIVTEINGKSIKDVSALTDEIKDLKEGDTFKVNYKRNDNSQSAEVKIPKKLKKADL